MIENIAKKTLLPLIDSTHTEHKKLGRLGEVDGLDNLPSSETKSFSETERRFLEKSADAWRNFKSQISSEHFRISRELTTANTKISHEIEPSEADCFQDQKKSLDLLEAELGEGSTTHNNLRSLVDDTERNLNEIKIQLGRPLAVGFKTSYIPIMTVLSMAELYVNRLSFELIFESMPIVATMLAAAVGMLLIFFAHIIGTQSKRTQCPITSRDNSKSYWAIFFIVSVSIILMYSLALMRQQLLDLNSTEISLDQMLETENGLDSSTDVLLSSSSISFLVINFAIFISGVILAFFRHDSHPFYEKYSSEYIAAKSAFLSHLKTYEKKHVDILREFQLKLSESSQLRRIVEKNVRDLESQKNLLISAEEEFRERYVREIFLCLSEYREKNVAARTTPPPIYFSLPLEPQIRSVLA
jgi:hypothetical protein